MKSPNNIVIDNIDNDDIVSFHQDLDTLRQKYNVRIRIKDNGRANKPLRDLPKAEECYNDLL
jgi:hypothetical protein